MNYQPDRQPSQLPPPQISTELEIIDLIQRTRQAIFVLNNAICTCETCCKCGDNLLLDLVRQIASIIEQRRSAL